MVILNKTARRAGSARQWLTIASSVMSLSGYVYATPINYEAGYQADVNTATSKGLNNASTPAMNGVPVLAAPVASTAASTNAPNTAEVAAVKWLRLPVQHITSHAHLFVPVAANISVESAGFAVFIGNEDVTTHFKVSSTQSAVAPHAAAVLEGDFSQAPLDLGESVLKIYMPDATDRWQLLAQQPLDVTQPVVSTYTPSVVVTAASQVWEEHNAMPPPHKKYVEADIQAGLHTTHSGTALAGKNDMGRDITTPWQVNTQLNVVGASYEPKALQYNEKGSAAPKIDLASYLLDAHLNSALGQSDLGVGAVESGNHELLVSHLANRGVSFKQTVNKYVDLSVASQAGSSLWGVDNILGMADAEHRMNSANIGLELWPRAGALRLETSFLQAMVKPSNALNTATSQDAAQSRGMGLKLSSQSLSGNVRGQLLWAQSDYTPRGNSLLLIPAGPSKRSSAYNMSLNYDAFNNQQFAPLGEKWPITLSFNIRHDHADPLYQSLAASVHADNNMSTVAINGAVGAINWQLQHAVRSDNVNDDHAFLKNHGQDGAVSLNIPLSQLYKTMPNVWLKPDISLSQSVSHSYADHAFIPLGQSVFNLPDLQAVTQVLSSNWHTNTLNITYQLSRTSQDNNQLLHQLEDVLDIGHSLSSSWQVDPSLNVSGGCGWHNSEQLNVNTIQTSYTADLALGKQIGKQYQFLFSGNAFNTRVNTHLTENTGGQLQFKLLKTFNGTMVRQKTQGQWYVQYGFRQNRLFDSSTSPQITDLKNQTLQLGLSLSLF